MPQALNLLILVGGSVLLLAALVVAWAEKRLLSELAYQYNTMATLFRHAERRFATELESLRPGEADFPTRVRYLQDFIFALGKEALEENAEWLLLHRARPMEPVLPG
jgi:hypothetical protein